MSFFVCTLILLLIGFLLQILMMKVESKFNERNVRIAVTLLILIGINICCIYFSKHIKIDNDIPEPVETIVLPPIPTPPTTLTPNPDDTIAQMIKTCVMTYLTKENDSILSAKFEEVTDGWILAKTFDEEDKPVVVQFCDKNHNVITDEKEIIDKCCKVIQTYYMEIWNMEIPDKIKADPQLYTVTMFLLNIKVDE